MKTFCLKIFFQRMKKRRRKKKKKRKYNSITGKYTCISIKHVVIPIT